VGDAAMVDPVAPLTVPDAYFAGVGAVDDAVNGAGCETVQIGGCDKNRSFDFFD